MKHEEQKRKADNKEKTPVSSEEAFVRSIRLISEKRSLVFQLTKQKELRQIQIYFWENSPMWIRIDLDQENDEAFLVGVVRTYEVPHERTDYNELISLIWAASLRASNTASVRILDIPHPVMDPELLGRYLVFDKQPAGSFVSLQSPNIPLIEKILDESIIAAHILTIVYRTSGGCTDEESCGDYDELAASISRKARWKRKVDSEIGNKRAFPSWTYFRRIDHGVSFISLNHSPAPLFQPTGQNPNETIVETPNGFLVATDSIKNHISNSTVSKLRRLIDTPGNKPTPIETMNPTASLSIIPTESHLICFASDAIIAIDNEGGYESYLEEESRLRERHQKEAALLHSSVQFEWNQKLPDDRIESLALDLLKREPGVRRAKQIGSSRAADGGRDLMVEWWMPPSPWETSTDHQAFTLKRIVVQCKAHKTAINRTKVGDAVGTVDLFEANGYLLIAFPGVTPSLIDYLGKVPPMRNVWADYWEPADLEDRLRRNLDIASRYKDLITVKAS